MPTPARKGALRIVAAWCVTVLCSCCLSSRYENTEKRIAKVASKGLLYLGMGVSGGEEGARRGEAWCGA